jgi:hypothetical protein
MNHADSDWNELAAGKPFIVDLGINPEISGLLKDAPTKTMGRFGAFVPVPNMNRHQIVEVSDDLEHLKVQYGVSDELVLRMKSQNADINPGS